mmetsp:Transcript_25500/g.33319  ORF Transcript_25500/g.33319 Transcript_25500/m.33319 type:complete len:385 (+) Transcript_25500:128-1282(+)|eukprot:CAMPEP_0117744172 /NCGR_PEP_ID=MMETSP0947-20121206/6593_1 /TAXON_ID=44440 /ORGANISM="Chattonella subsalsa, Strain CCMP2191" /LENGTH=384 /DNA_ID=CAMNT_0005561055 /DNA_START=100 /DNA_END=1254 /DNA_ORIENTATION=+
MIKHSESNTIGNQEEEGGGKPPPKVDGAASNHSSKNEGETLGEGFKKEPTENGYFNKEAYHPQQTIGGGGKYKTSKGKEVEIRDVWAENLEVEMHVIRKMAEKYQYIAMDTEFPGVVARPIADYNSPDYQYQTLRCNVDLLKIIQLGLAFVNAQGEVEGCCCWQFNFKFNLKEDIYAQESIDLLKASGISFTVHEQRGIDVQYFGELLITSGLVLLDNISWISFHSGYDFGYLLKILTAQALPAEENRFFEILKIYFPNIYDIKYLVASVDGVHGGLQKLAEEFEVERIGPMHQAGSDSLLTALTFFAIVESKFGGMSNLEEDKYIGELYGLGGNSTVYKPKSARMEHMIQENQSLASSSNGANHLSNGTHLSEAEGENFNLSS